MWPILTLLVVGQAGVSPPEMAPQGLMRRVDPETYILGPGDVLLVSITGPVLESHRVVVGPDGRVSVPVLGLFEAAGKTVKGLEAEMNKVLPSFYKDAHLSLQLLRLRAIKIYILGEVERPGVYSVPALTRLSEALSQAALPRAPLQPGQRPTLTIPGIAPTGSQRRVELRRSGRVFVVDLFKVLKEGRVDLDPIVEAGDVIFVPLRGRLVTISGEVFSPGTYELLPGEGLPDLIRMAGGVLPTASKANIRIERKVGEGRKLIFSGEEAFKEPLQDGDLVIVPSMEELRGEVQVKGAVRKPGKFKLAEGMKVADLLRLAGGLTPRAVVERAYILRPEKGGTSLFFLEEVGMDFALKDGDILVVPGIEEVQGYVEIEGEVRKPGKYPLVEGMTLRDLIKLAGGLTPKATIERAYVTRPVEGGTRLIFVREAGLDLRLSDGDKVKIPSLEGVQGQVEVRGAVRK
ncbi:MAG TPA: hypothetical protein EYP65_00710, partial [Armatimonadetes bacterium]|nr:hypothetical protein [Armatimonadota bacterium]